MSVTRFFLNVFSKLEQTPHSLIAFSARFSMAAIFWLSAQTKIEGFSINIISGEFEWGMPYFSEATISLFRDEYRLPLLSPEWAAVAATWSEHIFAVLLLIGLGGRVAALGLLVITLIIQFFVYPDAYPTHGAWAVCLIYIIAHGPGIISIDYFLKKHIKIPVKG